MTHTTSSQAAEEFVCGYGQDWRLGVLADHGEAFVEAGGTHRNGQFVVWAVLPNGKAYPVVCGHIVMIDTEDGPMTARCGKRVNAHIGACEEHAQEMGEWLDMGEAEKVAWERAREWHPGDHLQGTGRNEMAQGRHCHRHRLACGPREGGDHHRAP